MAVHLLVASAFFLMPVAGASPEQIAGVVRSVSVDSLTVETSATNGGTVTVLMTPKTKALMNNASSTVTLVTVGDRVAVSAKRDKSGTLTAVSVAWVPRRVKNVEFWTTNSPQLQFSMRIAVDPQRGPVAQSGTGPAIKPAEGHLFLFVSVTVTGSGSVTEGKDYYLTDGKGVRTEGYLEFHTNEWVGASGTESRFEGSRTMRFFYHVPKDRVVGSIFHFLDADYRVSEMPASR
jgi:hypothetical protein